MATVVKFTSAGSAIVTALLAASNAKYVHWGTGTTAAAATDTALQTPGSEARVSGTQSQQTTDHTNDTYQVVGTLTKATSSAAITEAGVFDNTTGGNLYTRATFDAINVDVGDSIQFTFKVKHDHS
jgi:hypothetical protein